MKTHVIKTEKEYYRESVVGNKTFEIRENDRDYKTGDHVDLTEWDKGTGEYTGNSFFGRITYVTDYAQKPGFVVFGVEFL